MIPALAGLCQPLERRVEILVQPLQRALQRPPRDPAARRPSRIRLQPIRRGFGISPITEILLCITQSATQSRGVRQRYICNDFKYVSAILQANTELVQLASGTRTRFQQALRPAPRAPRASQNIDIGDPAAQAKVAPAWTAGKQLDCRPIRSTLQPTGESLHGLLPGRRQLADAGAASQGWLCGEDIQSADLGQQVGDPLECCPVPERLLRGKRPE